MKILFYDTKSYDKESFEATLKKFPGIQIDYIRSDLDPRTAALADGFDAVCAFVSSNVSEATLKILHEKGVRLVLLRCAGYNNVDLEKAAACPRLFSGSCRRACHGSGSGLQPPLIQSL